MSLSRSLNARQLSMIAIGGAIGTGLFLASGNSIHAAGPGGAILAYLVVGVMVYFLMTSLGEMSAYKPVAGSFCQYASDYVSPGFGFAMGVNYWFNWAITLAAEISAATIIMQYWFPHISSIAVGLVIIGLVLGINLLSVKWFGESEYWLSMIKVATIIFFLVLGCLIIAGLVGGGKPVYFHNLSLGGSAFHHGWLAVFGVMMIAGFSFQGTELIGVAAGESKNPKKDIPKATKLIFWRILLFYIFTIVVISCLIPYTDKQLVGATVSNVAYSPFTMVMKLAHIPGAAWIINAVILTAVFSAANSGSYAASRSLYQLAQNGSLPSIFGKVSKKGVPVVALLLTLAVGSLAFLSSYFAQGSVYMWLIAASALSGFIAWIGIAISHLRFRRDFIKNGGNLSDLPYRAKFHPYSTIIALGMCLIILFGQDYEMLIGRHISWAHLTLTYSSLIIFLLLWGGYTIKSLLTRRRAKAPFYLISKTNLIKESF